MARNLHYMSVEDSFIPRALRISDIWHLFETNSDAFVSCSIITFAEWMNKHSIQCKRILSKATDNKFSYFRHVISITTTWNQCKWWAHVEMRLDTTIATEFKKQHWTVGKNEWKIGIAFHVRIYWRFSCNKAFSLVCRANITNMYA